MKISVIVCAAGKGLRAGFEKNKLLAPLSGAPVIYHTVAKICSLAPLFKKRGDELFEVIIAASPRDMAEITAICAPFGCKITEGGDTRTASVYNALKQVTGDVTLIQDGARPFTSSEQYIACVESVKKYNSGVIAMPATDTVAVAKDGYIGHIPARNTVFNIQTPQGFLTSEIKSAYENAVQSGENFTDDSSVYSRYIAPARLCGCGSAENRKLTFKEDFVSGEESCVKSLEEICRKSVKARADASTLRVGFGVDVHAFGKPQDYVILCGVKIPCDSGFIAHSDGDVAIHAVMDAILSAAGLKDIGNYFSDADQTYKNADSGELLKKVVAIANKNGYTVTGLSIAIQAEKPRLSSYIDRMICRIETLTGVDRADIAIAAGTCEGLGFVGEKRGVCAYCAAALIQDKK